jgi:prevent-host-death family protein
MKDTARFSRMVEEAEGPVTITKNGYDHLVVMTVSDFHALEEQVAEAKLLAKIAQAQADIVDGRVVDGKELLQKTSERYGL